jgi:hypothetical protein
MKGEIKRKQFAVRTAHRLWEIAQRLLATLLQQAAKDGGILFVNSEVNSEESIIK